MKNVINITIYFNINIEVGENNWIVWKTVKQWGADLKKMVPTEFYILLNLFVHVYSIDSSTDVAGKQVEPPNNLLCFYGII